LALIGSSVAAFTSIYSAADRKTAVIVLVRAIPQGQLIASADLGEARIAVSSGVDFIPFSQVALAAGKRAAAALPAGSLLTESDLTDGPAIAAGDAVVGVALKDGAYPGSGLSPGDQVQVVQTAAPGTSVAPPSTNPATSTAATAATGGGAVMSGVSGVTITGTDGSDAGILVSQATVFAVTAPSASSGSQVTLLVSLQVPTALAAQVATASAADQVGLVLLPSDPASGTTTGASADAATGTGDAAGIEAGPTGIEATAAVRSGALR